MPQRRLSILQVTRQFYPSVAGVEVVVENLGRELIRLGHRCEVVTLNHLFYASDRRLPAEENRLGILVRRIPYWGGRRFFVAPSVLHWLRDFDVVHVHNTDFFCDFLARTRFLHHKPLLLTTHGGFFHTSSAAWLKRLYFGTITRGSLRRFDVVTAVSESDRQLFVSVCDRVRVIHDGVDFPTYSAVEKRIEPGLLVYVGRLASNKRVDALLKACALVYERMPHVRLVLIGMDFEDVRPKLEALAGQLGVQSMVQFLGSVPGSVLRENLARANLFVSASEYESFGLSVVEAMATGTVPVVNRLPPFEQFIEPGQNGWFCDFSRPGEAARVLVKALCCPMGRLELMGRRARAVAEQYDWAHIVEEWESLYYRVLGV
ncbi:MAG: glycosyltransferase family 4 protein [Anaerolineae bacterium]